MSEAAGVIPLHSEDGLLGGRLRLRQPTAGYRVAIDPVFLAAAVPAGPRDTVLDIGCGVGAAALCLAARVPGCRVTGIDVQRDLISLAGDSPPSQAPSHSLVAPEPMPRRSAV